jgi:hypothetical protein
MEPFDATKIRALVNLHGPKSHLKGYTPGTPDYAKIVEKLVQDIQDNMVWRHPAQICKLCFALAEFQPWRLGGEHPQVAADPVTRTDDIVVVSDNDSGTCDHDMVPSTSAGTRECDICSELIGSKEPVKSVMHFTCKKCDDYDVCLCCHGV